MYGSDMALESSEQIAPVVDTRKKVERVCAPRPCKLPSCRKPFTPIHKRYDGQEFCCQEHKSEFWRLVRVIGERILTEQGSAAVKNTDTSTLSGSQLSRVRELLMAGTWVNLQKRLPDVGVARRVWDLRKAGMQIEMRRVGRNVEYRVVKG